MNQPDGRIQLNCFKRDEYNLDSKWNEFFREID